MLKKKSYMNNKNLLAEGFFDKLAKLLKLSTSDERKLKKNPKLRTALGDYHQSLNDLEKYVQDFTGDKKFTLPYKKFKLSDFI